MNNIIVVYAQQFFGNVKSVIINSVSVLPVLQMGIISSKTGNAKVAVLSSKGVWNVLQMKKDLNAIVAIKAIITIFLVQLVAPVSSTGSQMVQVDACGAHINASSVTLHLKHTVGPAILGMSCLLLYLVAWSHKESTLMEREAVMLVRM